MRTSLEHQDRGLDEASGAITTVPRNGATVDMQVELASQAMSGLTNDEHALVYGVLYAHDASRGFDTHCGVDTSELAAVLGSFRLHHCAWCHTGLAEHGLDLEANGLEVRCQRDEEARLVNAWLRGPVRSPVWRWLVAITLWVGIPLASLGLLAWVMPSVAALVHHRRRWVIAATVWIASFLVTIVVAQVTPNALFAGFFFLAQWVAAVVYGGLQVKPWLAVLPPPRQQRPAQQGR